MATDYDDPTQAHIDFLEITLQQLERWIANPALGAQEKSLLRDYHADLENALRHLCHALLKIDNGL